MSNDIPPMVSIGIQVNLISDSLEKKQEVCVIRVIGTQKISAKLLIVWLSHTARRNDEEVLWSRCNDMFIHLDHGESKKS